MKWSYVSVLLIAGCSAALPPAQSPTLPSAQSDSCEGRQYGELIGQDATALERVLILRQVRVIRSGTAVTLDFVQARLNFEIDAQNRIARIYCG